MNKLDKLETILQKMGSVLVAYSGGLDSTFLLKVAHDVLGEKVLAVTADSETYPAGELKAAKKIAKQLRVRRLVVKTNELSNKKFTSNPRNRCYFCKKELFRKLNSIAAGKKINFVIDASNIDDKKDFRPGSIAKKELKVRSPLEEAGIRKAEIRRFSKKLGLSTADKPPMACLASRIPYATPIDTRTLSKIGRAEEFLHKVGFKQVRVRHYNGLCRIEVPKNDIAMLLRKGDLVVENLKKLGYNYITVDLAGYRTGSMNTPHLRAGNVKRYCGRKPTE